MGGRDESRKAVGDMDSIAIEKTGRHRTSERTVKEAQMKNKGRSK